MFIGIHLTGFPNVLKIKYKDTRIFDWFVLLLQSFSEHSDPYSLEWLVKPRKEEMRPMVPVTSQHKKKKKKSIPVLKSDMHSSIIQT